MKLNKTIGVVVCAYNEETQIGGVLRSIPSWVDRIIVVNDASTDKTTAATLACIEQASNELSIPLDALARELKGNSVEKRADRIVLDIFNEEASRLTPAKIVSSTPEKNRIILVEHERNAGKGAALATGLRFARDLCLDIVVTIDGDGQMDCDEMHLLVDPICMGKAGYVKGNRLDHRSASRMIPKVRLIGNSVLSILTKIASGYWQISDSQTGYAAISKEALRKLKLDQIFPKYGVPNDLLVKLNIAQTLIAEVTIKPVYRVGEQSKMKILKVIPSISWLLIGLFFRRMWEKYFLKSFHPLFLLYLSALLCTTIGIPFGAYLFAKLWIFNIRPPLGYYFLEILLLVIGFQSLLFAMWMDVEDNRRLQVQLSMSN